MPLGSEVRDAVITSGCGLEREMKGKGKHSGKMRGHYDKGQSANGRLLLSSVILMQCHLHLADACVNSQQECFNVLLKTTSHAKHVR